MARIIPFPGDPHEQVQALLPWYLNGTLDDAETAGIDAHLAECERCRGELAAERALRTGIAGAALDPDQGWSRIHAEIAGTRRGGRGNLLRSKVALGWALAAQLAVAALLLTGMPSLRPEPPYHTLGSAPATAPADAIILFEPTTQVSAMRAALESAGARIVSGPTARGAYLLSLPAASRDAALDRLRGRPGVILAEPLDPEPR